MSGPDRELQRLSPEDARRRRRLYRVLGAAILVLAGLALVWARFYQASAGDEAAARAGARALARAVQGERAAFDEAQEHFARASRGMVLDAYPVFALELTRQLAVGEVKVTDEALRPAVEALATGDLAGAREHLAAAPEAARHEWLERLLGDMAAP